MGLFDSLKKTQPAAPAPVSAPVEESKELVPQWLREDVLMEGFPRDLSLEIREEMMEKFMEADEYKDERPQDAAALYLKYAQKGSPEAMYWLSECYECGDGVEENQQEYYRWLWRSAYAGYPTAQAAVSNFYCFGDECVPQDYPEAYAWLLRAAKSAELEDPDHELYLYEDEIKEWMDDIRNDVFQGTAREALRCVEMYKEYINHKS